MSGLQCIARRKLHSATHTPGLPFATIRSYHGFVSIGSRITRKCAKKLFNGGSKKQRRTVERFRPMNTAKMNLPYSTKTMATRFGFSCVDICIGIHSKRVGVINSPVLSCRHVQFGCGKRKKCMINARRWGKGMLGSICGRIGTNLITGRFGQGLHIWNITPSFKRTLQSKHIGRF